MKGPYAELPAPSNFSFLEGASHIEELVLRARELGYEALALTDHDGLHGAMEFAQCAGAWGLRRITGSEVTLADGVQGIDPGLSALRTPPLRMAEKAGASIPIT